ncbi:hypothetical protein [Streptomyces sp. NPDC046887]|uniref:hypothetical protein n=1 Tax=Streptomyces sp. NPDC046887 TaxID=3155472 RepID=UPI0033F060AA
MPQGQKPPEVLDGPYLVVPYGPADDGSRPLSVPGAVYYRCPGILIDHQPYDPSSPLDPGEPLSLSVLVKNLGALSCLVTARFYCTSPATAWLPAPVGSSTFYLRAGTDPAAESPPVPDFVPADHFARLGLATPEHFCFFVEVTTPLDLAPGSHNAATDRHCGQQNVQIVKAVAGRRLVVPFEVADRGHQRYAVSLGPARHLEGTLPLPEEALRIIDLVSGEEAVTALQTTLEAGERRAFQAVVDVPDTAAAGDTAHLVIEQTALGPEEGVPVGAIGVTVLVDG